MLNWAKDVNGPEWCWSKSSSSSEALGSIIFTGASASLRGRSHYAAFSSAKAGLRAVAQSMARELGKEGIHVCHVVVDGVVKNEATLETLGLKDFPESEMLMPDHIASSFVFLHQQKPSAWTHELDLRPHSENW